MAEAKVEKLYAFAQVPELAQLIVDFADLVIPKEWLLQDEAVKKDPVERDTHVTLFFGLPKQEPSAELKKALLDLGSFEVQLGELSKFECRDKVFEDGTKHSFDVAYIAVVDPSGKLQKLHDLLGADFKAKDEHEKYTPHLTIAYLKPGQGQAVVERGTKLGFFRDKGFKIDKVLFRQFRSLDKSVLVTLKLE